MKLDKSNNLIELQSENIELISVTEEVSKEDTSIEVKLLQPLNIIDISFTNEVSKLDKSIDSN